MWTAQECRLSVWIFSSVYLFYDRLENLKHTVSKHLHGKNPRPIICEYEHTLTHVFYIDNTCASAVRSQATPAT